jgi:hypothetical protein
VDISLTLVLRGEKMMNDLVFAVDLVPFPFMLVFEVIKSGDIKDLDLQLGLAWELSFCGGHERYQYQSISFTKSEAPDLV